MLLSPGCSTMQSNIQHATPSVPTLEEICREGRSSTKDSGAPWGALLCTPGLIARIRRNWLRVPGTQTAPHVINEESWPVMLQSAVKSEALKPSGYKLPLITK